MNYFRYTLFLMALAVAGCDSSTAPSRQTRLPLTGAGIADTVGAILVNPLRCLVRDTTGTIVPAGTVVRFSAIPNDLDGGAQALVQGFTDTDFSESAIGTTDDSGRTGVYVKLGTKSGAAGVVVTIPSLGIVDTAWYTVKPGAALKVVVTPSELTVSARQSAKITATVVDRYDNPRSDPIIWSASSPNVTLTQSGVVKTSHAGIYMITARAGTLSGSTVVSLLPQGRITAVLNGSIIAVNLDGTNLQTLAANVSDGGIGIHPRWIPNTNKVIFTTYNGSVQTLKTVDEAGTITPFFSTTPPFVSHAAEPSPNTSGRWMYFSAFDSRCSAIVYCLYRAKPDGSLPELLGNYIQSGIVTWRPAPSPDGSKVAFVTSAAGAVIKVFDVTNRTVSSWSISGQEPRWSPVGEWIAYLAPNTGSIAVVNADGMKNRTVTQPGARYNEEQISWSPDGRLLLATASSGYLELIDVQTGASITLAFSQGMHAPDWK